jgi:hypothetical protein
MNLRRHIEPPREQYSLFDTTMPLRNEGEVNALPSTARELVDVMGLEATIDLVKTFGGDDLKIPEVVNGTSRMWDILVETVGPQAAAKLVSRFAGTTVYVPKCQAVLMTHRDREIIRRFDAGTPFDVLRREHNFTRRHLYRVLKKPL